jgi:hypothetical protein
MPYPKKQYVMARTRGRRTQYFYAERLKDLYERVKAGEAFRFFTLTRGKTFTATVIDGVLRSTEVK